MTYGVTTHSAAGAEWVVTLLGPVPGCPAWG